jgi:2-keto-4-pentenoate hydratase/2-oxohepta-3-ene-1,7-dioic acid hydratase in catechol pathway
MRWVRFLAPGATGPAFGALSDDGEHVDAIGGDLFGERRPSGRRWRVADTTLLAPIVPPTFYAATGNYPGHFRNTAARAGRPVELPTRCEVGYRASNALTGPGQPIVIPPDASGTVQLEAELVVVIGRRARHLTEAEALGCVFGYTIGNDVSERTWQASDRTIWRAKNSDTFKPMGPWIETDPPPPEGMTTTVRLNGTEVARFPTHSMIFGVARTLAAISRYMTLHPGDVVWMGTEDPTPDMVAGDRVEIAITGLGVLANPVVAG